MDDLAESIGKLSTNAKEWKPGASYTPSSSLSPSSAPQNSSAFQPASPRAGISGGSGGGFGAHAPTSPAPSSPQPIATSPRGRSTGSWKVHPPGARSKNSDGGGWGNHVHGGVKEFVPSGGGSRGPVWSSQQRQHLQQHQARVGVGGGVSNWAGGASQGGPTFRSGALYNYDDGTHVDTTSIPYGSPRNNSNESDTPGQSSSWWSPSDSTTTTVPSGPVPPPPQRSIHSLGLSDELWRHYHHLALDSRREMDPTDPRHKAVPPSYTNAFPLDTNNAGGRSSFGYPTSTFKVTSREDGNLYCLRRLDNCRAVSHKIAAAVTDRWAMATDPTNGRYIVHHPGLVRLHKCFCSMRAVFFVHRYYPGSQTLREKFLDPNNGGGVPLPETLIWSCVSQLVSAIRAVHMSSLACRSLQVNHILCTPDVALGSSPLPGGGETGGRIRIRINCTGVVDALEFEARKQLSDLQREDMRDLGRIVLTLATGTVLTPNNSDADTIRRCDAFLGRNYSPELHTLGMSLVSAVPHPPTVYDVSNMVASRAFDELDASHSVLDRVDSALAVEYESGRALRLLLKLGFVNERPEFGMDRRWSETGDCYVLKLFRDYVFHQADGSGRPVMDLGHVVASLNKLDAADEEKIVLASRDGMSLLVVSFADVARCLEKAYCELCAGSVPPSMEGHGPMGY